MAAVCATSICVAPEGVGMPYVASYSVGTIFVLVGIGWFMVWKRKAITIDKNE